ncbi:MULTISPECIES: DoxX family protein [unclassified Agromyces]|uniref:DoxX family protein n=1 Tax=unclassified Agromyces TaxID=2639701 RepID=UPI003014ED2F
MPRRRRPVRRPRPRSAIRSTARWALAGLLAFSGVAHLTFARSGFRIAVPDWVASDRTAKDAVVVTSGVAEAMLGVALVAAPPRERSRVGIAVATFFVAVFPGNVHHWRTGRSVPLMRTDRARFLRLFLQPVLVAWALWSTAGAGRPRDA